MLSRLDDIIFPNRCEVIEIETSQRCIYPIFKNGSTSIIKHAKDQHYKFLLNTQIKRANVIDIILRDPLDRFISGFNTFVYNTKRENPQLDVDTIIYFAEQYLFLNRHYCPQISWLVHLSKYTSPHTTLQFHGMDSLVKFTPQTLSPIEEPILDQLTIDRLRGNEHNELYLRLDNYLIELIGQSMTFDEVLAYIKNKDPLAYAKLP
jgi:hypothetical protein